MLENYIYLCVMDCPLPFLQLEILSRDSQALNLPPVPPKFLKIIKLHCLPKAMKLGIGKKFEVSSLAY